MRTRLTTLPRRVESRYVEITREEFEEWMDRVADQWERDPDYEGIYLIPMSEHVAIKVSSTLSSADQNVERGEASAQFTLVSRHHGHVLNRRAQQQSHFQRTKNWRQNWKKGVERMKNAYHDCPSFYDQLGQIQDRQAYRRRMLDKIEQIPSWETNSFLADLHNEVDDGGVLTDKQLEVLEDIRRERMERQPDAGQLRDMRVEELRKLWAKANRQNDQWTMDFAQNVAEQLKNNQSITSRQRETAQKKMNTYGLDASLFDKVVTPK